MQNVQLIQGCGNAGKALRTRAADETRPHQPPLREPPEQLIMEQNRKCISVLTSPHLVFALGPGAAKDRRRIFHCLTDSERIL